MGGDEDGSIISISSTGLRTVLEEDCVTTICDGGMVVGSVFSVVVVVVVVVDRSFMASKGLVGDEGVSSKMALRGSDSTSIGSSSTTTSASKIKAISYVCRTSTDEDDERILGESK